MVSADESEQASKLAERLGLTYPLGSDPARTVIKAWGVEDAENEIAWPALFIIGRDQKITHTATLDTYKERTTVAAILEKL